MHAATTRREAFRRTRRVAAGVGLAGVLTFMATAPGGAAQAQVEDSDFNNGTGNAIASAYKVNPIVGNLSFGITTGLALAGHQNTAAQGQAAAVDMGVIGTTLAAEGCMGADPTWPEEDQPQAVVVFSSDEGAEQGVEEDEAGLVNKFARAHPAPFAEAITTITPMGDPAGVFLSGGQAIASSGVVDGHVREARAYTRIGSVVLGGGAVELRGLEWEAIHRTGAVEETIGRFHVGALLLGGEETPLPSEPFEQAAALDEALRPVGFTITAPRVREAQGIVFVDPLKVGVIPAEARESIVGPIIGAVQPLREALFAELLTLDCGELAEATGRSFPSKSIISVFDIALSSVSGAGALLLELGGVQATTAEIDAFAFPPLPDLPDLPPVLDAAPSLADGGGSSAGLGTSSGGVPGTTGGDTPAGTPSETGTGQVTESTPVQNIAGVGGSRGGALALVGGLGLATMLATAEGDRRKMRRALREIPVEA
jgi:hypothetical protein